MKNEMQNRIVRMTINLPMEFPEDWDDDMINFYLNESSWCWSNIIDELKKYEELKNSCICGICSGEVVSKQEEEIREKLDAKPIDDILPSCPNCTCLNNCKEYLKNPNIEIKCIWYGWLKNNNIDNNDSKGVNHNG